MNTCQFQVQLSVMAADPGLRPQGARSPVPRPCSAHSVPVNSYGLAIRPPSANSTFMRGDMTGTFTNSCAVDVPAPVLLQGTYKTPAFQIQISPQDDRFMPTAPVWAVCPKHLGWPTRHFCGHKSDLDQCSLVLKINVACSITVIGSPQLAFVL